MEEIPEDLNSYAEQYANLKFKLKEIEVSAKAHFKIIEASAIIALFGNGSLQKEFIWHMGSESRLRISR